MRILTKVECGLVIMVDIALYSENKNAVTLYDMAERRCISVKYLEHIVTRLRQGSLVKSIKGPHGGYVLSRSPDKITIKQIIDAIDITLIGNDIAELPESSGDITETLNEVVWSRIEDQLSALTSSLTLSDIMGSLLEKQKLGNSDIMYYI